jgi:hypothetical protein
MEKKSFVENVGAFLKLKNSDQYNAKKTEAFYNGVKKYIKNKCESLLSDIQELKDEMDSFNDMKKAKVLDIDMKSLGINDRKKYTETYINGLVNFDFEHKNEDGMTLSAIEEKIKELENIHSRLAELDKFIDDIDVEKLPV